MKTINLYFDFKFTSLSPDAQPISVGIVSDETKPCDYPEMYKGRDMVPWREYQRKQFYAEFSDFDINRCDDWVKEHVVGKLKHYKSTKHICEYDRNNVDCVSTTKYIKEWLSDWLDQFSDYKIQFVCDCGTYDWYWMVQLLAEWDERQISFYDENFGAKNAHLELKKSGFEIDFCDPQQVGCDDLEITRQFETGLPKLPENISPVPFDLNDLIAMKKGITPAEAFDIERLGSFCQNNPELYNQVPQTHNALFDAKVIKESYHSLK